MSRIRVQTPDTSRHAWFKKLINIHNREQKLGTYQAPALAKLCLGTLAPQGKKVRQYKIQTVLKLSQRLQYHNSWTN